jgi:hypothetical protein
LLPESNSELEEARGLICERNIKKKKNSTGCIKVSGMGLGVEV